MLKSKGTFRNYPVFFFPILSGGLIVLLSQQQAEERDRAKMKDQWERMAVQAAAEAGPRTEETCSCIEGNPCVDPYVILRRLYSDDRSNHSQNFSWCFCPCFGLAFSHFLCFHFTLQKLRLVISSCGLAAVFISCPYRFAWIGTIESPWRRRMVLKQALTRDAFSSSFQIYLFRRLSCGATAVAAKLNDWALEKFLLNRTRPNTNTNYTGAHSEMLASAFSWVLEIVVTYLRHLDETPLC